MRTADEDREVSPAELRNFFVSNAYREKGEKTASSALANQIDRGAIKAFWQKAISVGRMPSGKYTCPIILKRFGLLQGDNLNNAGEYLFGNTHPLMLKAAIFATDDRNATIAKVLYLNKSIEQFGSGFKRIDQVSK